MYKKNVYFRNNKSNLIKSLCWAGTGLSVPILHRWIIPNNLPTLLQCLSEYTTLVRKCLACIKEQSIHSKSQLIIKPNFNLCFHNLNITYKRCEKFQFKYFD